MDDKFGTSGSASIKLNTSKVDIWMVVVVLYVIAPVVMWPGVIFTKAIKLKTSQKSA